MSTETRPAEQATTTVISLDAFCAEAESDAEASGPKLEILRIGRDASYISFFTTDGVPVAAHYLEEAEDWAPGYVQCTGDGCPACRAGLQASRFLLLPVVDRVQGRIALLRISAQKGPGKLVTEIGKILGLPDRENIVAKITRDGRYNYTVEPRPAPEHDPEIVRAVQRFVEQAAAGEIDLAASIATVLAAELAKHPRIARALALEGQG